MSRLYLLSLILISGLKCAFVAAFLSTERSRTRIHRRCCNPEMLRASIDDDHDDDSTFACFIPQKLSREDGQRTIDETIMPSREYDNRMIYGRDAQDLEASTIITANDPRMFFTYGEFPMSSLDELVDLALTHAPATTKGKKQISMIDLGSGCGRLVLYSALTRGLEDSVSWTIHGVEISDVLHDESLRASLTGLDSGCFQLVDSPSTTTDESEGNQFVLHRGPADEFNSLFEQAEIVFAYSTVFETAGFSEELGAIVLSRQWNEMLSESCSRGTVVITTDRCLDPAYGWKLVDRLDVDNREVMGSIGYIQIYQP